MENEISTLLSLLKDGIRAKGVPTEVTAATVAELLQAGAAARQSFADEMLAEKTTRARIGMKALRGQIYAGAVECGIKTQLIQFTENVTT